MTDIKIAPSILAANFADLGAECRAGETAGADWIHVDVMDGHFVPNISFGPAMCSALRPHISTVMDVHLMIAAVEPMLPAFIAAKPDVLTVHAEATPHLDRALQQIRDAGIKAGVALNPATPEHALDYVLDKVDLICVMTVNPGFGGQSFLASQLSKVERLRAMIDGRPIHLQVDGGVTGATIGAAVGAGADVLVAGSSVFAGGGTPDQPGRYAARIAALREAAQTKPCT